MTETFRSLIFDVGRPFYLFRILKFGYWYLPFVLAQSGESFDFAQDREPVERLVEPFVICILALGNFMILILRVSLFIPDDYPLKLRVSDIQQRASSDRQRSNSNRESSIQYQGTRTKVISETPPPYPHWTPWLRIWPDNRF
jgi:hypothetical protein